jgi:hypothetical protein
MKTGILRRKIAAQKAKRAARRLPANKRKNKR